MCSTGLSKALVIFLSGIVGACASDTSIGKLVTRAQKEKTLHVRGDLDRTALGKPGHLAVHRDGRYMPGTTGVAQSVGRSRGSVLKASQMGNSLQQGIMNFPSAVMQGMGDFVAAQKKRNDLLRELKRQPTSQVGDINAVDSSMDFSTKTYPKIDLATPGLRVVNQEPPVYMVDNFLEPSECDALISAAKSDTLESIKYNGRYVLLDHNRLWPVFPMILLSAIPKSHVLSSALSWESFERYLTVLGPNALMVGSMILLVPRIGEFLAPFVTKDSGAEAKSSKWTGLGSLEEQHPAKLAHESLLSRAENLCFAQRPQFETVKVTRYLKGAGQAVHADAYGPAEPGKEKEYFAEGGQRLAQCLVYLNDVPKEDGGSTKFFHPSLNGLAVQPKKGSALVFFPAFDDGSEDPRMMHSGETYMGDAAKWTAGTWLHQTPIQRNIPEQ
eukprot:gnl/MRDRNA2_/MRDRNA2_96336_c0_seq1.p1 gnl/MRDRNA2_/MRDRNA2_96336_c0~~gnl/MRDRNA2_/MRDRNA2_96336_c0_seq1.p1  ORF type:complete len:442 (+),score=78.34 gnl/MRDRNA2_/MRDRNA2_96336_c0_seq1:75-1400(+)